MAWPGFDGSLYTQEQFSSHVAGLTIGPYAKFIVMHATGSPTLKQWEQYPEQQRIVNLQRYYEMQLHWLHGPHLFISPTHIIGFSDLRTRGTHCSCWNFSSIGIETSGNWNTEDFNSGDGLKVRDNFVFAAAVLHKALGLTASPYKMGISGLHLHLQCIKDGHLECPKAGFDRDWMADLIDKKMETLGPLVANPTLVSTVEKMPTKPTDMPPVSSPAWIQESLNAFGVTPQLVVDGDIGPTTKSAIRQFQKARGLITDGITGPKTLDALQKEVTS